MDDNSLKFIFVFTLAFFCFLTFLLCCVASGAAFWLGFVLKSSPIYVLIFFHILADCINLFAYLIYGLPIAASNVYFFGGKFGSFALVCGGMVEYGWTYITLSQMVMAVDRFLVICLARPDPLSFKNVKIIVFFLSIASLAVVLTSIFIFPCCKLLFDSFTIGHAFIEMPNLVNYTSIYITTPLNIISSTCSLVCYAGVCLRVRQYSKNISGLSDGQRKKRRGEYMYVVHFLLLTFLHFFQFSVLRILYLFVDMEPETFQPIITAPGALFVIVSFLSSLVFLITNRGARRVLRFAKTQGFEGFRT